jgi:hypothetical protein
LGEKIKLSTATNDLKLYQGFFIIAFVLVPSVALYHFNSQLLQDGRIWNEATTRVEKNARNEEVVVGEKSVLRVRDTLYIPFVKSIREDSSRILNAENRNHQVKLYLAEKECV